MADGGADTSSEEVKTKSRRKGSLEIQGYPVEGLSIGGQETCVIFPTLRLAFDIGRCPQRAIAQDFLFISHGHMDHIVKFPAFFLYIYHFYFPAIDVENDWINALFLDC